MRKITKKKVGETAVKISGKVFRGNITFPNHFYSVPKTTLGLSTFYWVLIGAVSGGVLVIIVISGICVYKLRNNNKDTESTSVPTGGNTFVRNEININSEPKAKFGSFKRKKNNTGRLEEILDSPTKCKELEGVPTLGELAAIEAKESS